VWPDALEYMECVPALYVDVAVATPSTTKHIQLQGILYLLITVHIGNMISSHSIYYD